MINASYLQGLDWGILIGYFVILLAIGIWASTQRKKGSSLFLAENSLRWYHIGFSMWGTNVGPREILRLDIKILSRSLPQSRIRSTAPSRREPLTQVHSALIVYLFSAYRQSLF